MTSLNANNLWWEPLEPIRILRGHAEDVWRGTKGFLLDNMNSQSQLIWVSESIN